MLGDRLRGSAELASDVIIVSRQTLIEMLVPIIDRICKRFVHSNNN